jgi:hypothetical protein
MRYPSQKMASKVVHKTSRTVKHKQSLAKQIRVESKLEKEAVAENTMETDVTEPVRQLTDKEKLQAKLERKKANKAKNAYKTLRPHR